MKDDVTSFWDAVRKKWPYHVPDFNRLELHEQFQLIQAINTILMVLNDNSKGQK